MNRVLKGFINKNGMVTDCLIEKAEGGYTTITMSTVVQWYKQGLIENICIDTSKVIASIRSIIPLEYMNELYRRTIHGESRTIKTNDGFHVLEMDYYVQEGYCLMSEYAKTLEVGTELTLSDQQGELYVPAFVTDASGENYVSAIRIKGVREDILQHRNNRIVLKHTLPHYAILTIDAKGYSGNSEGYFVNVLFNVLTSEIKCAMFKEIGTGGNTLLVRDIQTGAFYFFSEDIGSYTPQQIIPQGMQGFCEYKLEEMTDTKKLLVVSAVNEAQGISKRMMNQLHFFVVDFHNRSIKHIHSSREINPYHAYSEDKLTPYVIKHKLLKYKAELRIVEKSYGKVTFDKVFKL